MVKGAAWFSSESDSAWNYRIENVDIKNGVSNYIPVELQEKLNEFIGLYGEPPKDIEYSSVVYDADV